MSSITFPYGQFTALPSSSNVVLKFNAATKRLTITTTTQISLEEESALLVETVNNKTPDEFGMVNINLDANVLDDSSIIQLVSIDNKTFTLQPQIKIKARKKDHNA